LNHETDHESNPKSNPKSNRFLPQRADGWRAELGCFAARLQQLSQVPTFAELGLKGFEPVGFFWF
jgi:hypothetical protein